MARFTSSRILLFSFCTSSQSPQKQALLFTRKLAFCKSWRSSFSQHPGHQISRKLSASSNTDNHSSHLQQDLPESSHPKGKLASGLYLVATPIGNLEDITLRALRVLKSADLILTEDTRHSAKLLQHYEIHKPTLSYHQFNETRRQNMVLERLSHGERLALISDAGMPGISDPGVELVMACIEANICVYPIPGPSAAITALVASGLSTNEFSFVGFLSTQASLRQERLAIAASETATQIIYVPPHKLLRVLDECSIAFGSSRRCVVAREMTKIHEEFWRGTLGEAKSRFSNEDPRGEITLVIEGCKQNSASDQPTEEDLVSELQAVMGNGKSISEAVKFVALKNSVRKKIIYELALKSCGKIT